MIYIPMNILEYRFDDQGNTTQIIVGFQAYGGTDNLNARLNITIEDIKSINPNWDFHNLIKDRAEVVARRKLRDWVMTEKTEEPEETQEEG